jgi:hypothetical protein
MSKITTIKELREAIEKFNDNDLVVVEIHEGVRHNDLYDFTIDWISDIDLNDGTQVSKVSEVRICI